MLTTGLTKLFEGRAAAARPVLLESARVFLRGGMGLLFVYAGLAKFLAPLPFMAALEAAGWLPPAVRHLLGVGLPALELSLGLALLLGWKQRLIAVSSFILVAAFTVFLLIEMGRGNSSCGCFGELEGPLATLTTGVGALIRNALLLTGALALCSRPADRWSLDHLLSSTEHRSSFGGRLNFRKSDGRKDG